MRELKNTKITIRQDLPTAVSSSFNGANLNTIGFNIDYIQVRDPLMCVQLMGMFSKASRLSKVEPLDSSDEAFVKASRLTKKIMEQNS